VSEPKPSHSILALDLVRGIASLEVVLGHVRGGNWVEFGALPADQKTILTSVFFFCTRLGHEAVLIFFVLSGFMVGGSLIERVKTERFRFSDYALDRTTRILVPLVPACIFTVAISFFGFGQATNLFQTLGNMIGLNGVAVETIVNNAPLWSLAYEIWFYVLAGSIALILSDEVGFLSVVALFICVLVFAKLNAAYLLFWIAGALTGQIGKMRRAGRLFAPGVLLMTCGIILYELGSDSKSIASNIVVSHEIAEAMICAGFSICIPFLKDDRINTKLSIMSAPVRWLSGISFSLYLTHYPLNSLLTTLMQKSPQLDVQSLQNFCIKIFLVLAVASVFWFVFERSSFKLRRLFKSRYRYDVSKEAEPFCLKP
jgi:peptidoglycan/LPS O-acetylase OafA/YrhL